MSVYKRGEVWWFKFHFAGQVVRESAKSHSKDIARDAERARRRQLEESWNMIRRRTVPPVFAIGASRWMASRPSIAPATEKVYRMAIANLTQAFDGKLLSDVSGADIAAYQTRRKRDGVSPRTANIEVSVLRGILRKHRLWEAISEDVQFLREDPSPGRALSDAEEIRLLKAAQASRCRSLYFVIMLALNTGLRIGEIRGLTWGQVDLLGNTLTVGRSKTVAGTGRVVPLNARMLAVLGHWRGLFPNAQQEHFVFPHERCGFAGIDRRPCIWDTDPGRSASRWTKAWEGARKSAGVGCRFHDLRHTFISRLAESQASDSTIMSLAGHVSRAMMARYSHIGAEAKRRAVDTIRGSDFDAGGAQNWAQFLVSEKAGRSN